MPWQNQAKVAVPVLLSVFLGACASTSHKTMPVADAKADVVVAPGYKARLDAQRTEFAETLAVLKNPNVAPEDATTLTGFLMLKYYAFGDSATKVFPINPGDKLTF